MGKPKHKHVHTPNNEILENKAEETTAEETTAEETTTEETTTEETTAEQTGENVFKKMYDAFFESHKNLEIIAKQLNLKSEHFISINIENNKKIIAEIQEFEKLFETKI